MFSFDTTEDPFLWMRLTGTVTPDDEADYLQALDLLQDRRTAFGLVSVINIESGEVGQETRRAQALWFKRNREMLARLCVGLVRVRPQIDPGRSDENFARAMPFPTQRIVTEDEALPHLRRWLADHRRRQPTTEAL